MSNRNQYGKQTNNSLNENSQGKADFSKQAFATRGYEEMNRIGQKAGSASDINRSSNVGSNQSNRSSEEEE
jgi:hypothetical protein